MNTTTRRALAGLGLAGLVISAAATAAPAAQSAHQIGTTGGQLSAVVAAVNDPIARADILARAKSWVDQKVPYSMKAYHPDPQGKKYRTDCSGFVSMALNLDQSLSTVTLPERLNKIAWNDLQPGDIVGTLGAGTAGADGHVVIFTGWANDAHTVFNTMEEKGGAGAVAGQRKVGFAVGSHKAEPYRYQKVL